jgi:GNAT superfamily N-acetyltransferase
MTATKVAVRPVTRDLARDAEATFASNPASAGCFCTWFLIPVAQYHAGGAQANREIFRGVLEKSELPVGLLAYVGDEPAGWCATGPRSRFVRALRVPSFKGRDVSEDDSVWLVPCFNVHPSHRREGVSRALLDGAVNLARKHGARAIEGFPFARGAKLGRESMVGLESVFESCGFVVSRRPSASRVVMRRNLT